MNHGEIQKEVQSYFVLDPDCLLCSFAHPNHAHEMLSTFHYLQSTCCSKKKIMILQDILQRTHIAQGYYHSASILHSTLVVLHSTAILHSALFIAHCSQYIGQPYNTAHSLYYIAHPYYIVLSSYYILHRYYIVQQCHIAQSSQCIAQSSHQIVQFSYHIVQSSKHIAHPHDTSILFQLSDP